MKKLKLFFIKIFFYLKKISPDIPWQRGTNLQSANPNIQRLTKAKTGVIGRAVIHKSYKIIQKYFFVNK